MKLLLKNSSCSIECCESINYYHWSSSCTFLFHVSSYLFWLLSFLKAFTAHFLNSGNLSLPISFLTVWHFNITYQTQVKSVSNVAHHDNTFSYWWRLLKQLWTHSLLDIFSMRVMSEGKKTAKRLLNFKMFCDILNLDAYTCIHILPCIYKYLPNSPKKII